MLLVKVSDPTLFFKFALLDSPFVTCVAASFCGC